MTNVKMPNGDVVSFPDDMPRDQIQSLIRKKFPDVAPPAPGGFMDTAADVLKSGGRGLLEGAAAVPGAVGDLNGLLQTIGNAGYEGVHRLILGPRAPEDQAKLDAARAAIPRLPTSADIISGMDKVTGGALKHTPMTTAGEYARTIGQFVPSAAVAGGGPGAVVKYGVLPAIASEGAGQLTKGTPVETAARISAGLATGVAAGLISSEITRLSAAKKLPTTPEIKAASQALYDAADAHGLLVTPDSYDRAVDAITIAAQKAGIDPAIQPKAYAALSRLNAAKGVGKSLGDMDTLRQIAGDAIASADPNERRLGYVLTNGLDDYLGNLKPTDVMAGNADAAVSALTQARALWKVKAKADIIDRALSKADNAVGANYTQAGWLTATRQKFRAIADNPNVMRKFSPDEQAAILKIVRGGPIENSLRVLGRFAPRGPVTGMALGAATVANPYLGAGLGLTAEGARLAATGLGRRNVSLLDQLVRSAAPMPGQLPVVATPRTTQELMAAILSGSAPARIPNEAP